MTELPWALAILRSGYKAEDCITKMLFPSLENCNRASEALLLATNHLTLVFSNASRDDTGEYVCAIYGREQEQQVQARSIFISVGKDRLQPFSIGYTPRTRLLGDLATECRRHEDAISLGNQARGVQPACTMTTQNSKKSG